MVFYRPKHVLLYAARHGVALHRAETPAGRIAGHVRAMRTMPR